MCREISHRFWSIRALEALGGFVYWNRLFKFMPVLIHFAVMENRNVRVVPCIITEKAKHCPASKLLIEFHCKWPGTDLHTRYGTTGVSLIWRQTTLNSISSSKLCAAATFVAIRCIIFEYAQQPPTHETIINSRAHTHTHYLSPWISPFTGKSQQ